VTSWPDLQNPQMGFMQNDEALQPRLIVQAPLPPVIGLQQSQLISGLSSHREPAFTLVTITRHQPETSVPEYQLLLGMDPKAPDPKKFQLFADDSLSGGFVFQSENGLARLTLSLNERGKPFVVGFRRRADLEEAYLGPHRAQLASYEATDTGRDPTILPTLQLGGLGNGANGYRGWIGELLIYHRALTDDELYGLFEYLEDKYGAQP
jgi:hypothetical protein